MIAALLAKPLSPHMVSGPQNQSIHSSFQRVMYANYSSPGEQPASENKLYKSIIYARRANTTSYDVFPFEGNTRRRMRKLKQQPPPVED